ncbi:MAG: aromatic amino acid ammonia-lyase [Pseudomonadota bacterium]
MIVLDGESFQLDELASVVYAAAPVSLSDSGLERMQHAHEAVAKGVAGGNSIYGLTTGLGSKSGEALSGSEIDQFAMDSIRARANAMGDSLPREIVRAAIAARLNSFMLGHSCGSSRLAIHYRDCLNAGVCPHVGRIGSIGAGDLCQTATLSLAMLGEGRIRDQGQGFVDAANALSETGLEIPKLNVGDNMALMNHGSVGVGGSAVALLRARRWLNHCENAVSAGIEAFQANLSPLHAVARGRNNCSNSDRGEVTVSQRLLSRLQGSSLLRGAEPRRLQDPLSIRNVSQILGSLETALRHAEEVCVVAMNSSTDSPQVDVNNNAIESTGAFMTPDLTIACEGVARSVDLVCTAQVARIRTYLTHRLTDLDQYLAVNNAASNGFAPLLKATESLLASIKAALNPVPFWPSVNADGVEDVFAQTSMRALNLFEALDLAETLLAIESIVVAEALQQRQPGPVYSADTEQFIAEVREKVPPLGNARALTADVESLKSRLSPSFC